MSILKVAKMGHPVLRKKCRELDPAEIRSERVQRLIDDMVETMREYEGVGLAAPQVHEPVRLSVIEFGGVHGRAPIKDAQTLSVFINPKVTGLDPTETGVWEGCLSVPGLRGWVERPSKIRVEYLDRQGESKSLTAQGFLATVLQHEFDHLDGVLYVDRIKDPTKLAFNEEFNRYLAPAESEDEAEEDEYNEICGEEAAAEPD